MSARERDPTMIAIYDLNEIPPLPLSVLPLVERIIQTARKSALQDQTFILVIEAEDSEDAVTEAIGWNPLHNPIDGIRFDDRAFIPYWAWLELHGRWYRLIHTVGNGSFAYELLIEASGAGPFHAMCKGA